MNGFVNSFPELQVPLQFLTSLAIGLLLGLNRQRNPGAKAGLRTCALVAMFGTTSGLLAQATATPWLLAVGLLLTGAMIIAAYTEGQQHEADSGTTTIIAVILCYVFGAMVWYGYIHHAVSLAIAATALLHFKTELHGFSEKLAPNDIASILQFAVLTFIVLPLLPDRGFGPYQALNPHNVWLMVVLVAGIGLAGYLALRLLDTRHSVPVVGALGGLVSSTATTLVYARQCAAHAELKPLSSAIIGMANITVLFRLAVISSIAAPSALPVLLPALGFGIALSLPLVAYQARAVILRAPSTSLALENPTNLQVSIGFGAMYGIVLLAAAWLAHVAGSGGLYVLALASGIVDVDAITLSSLQLLANGTVTADTAAIAIALAYLSSVLFKLGITLVIGGRALAWRCAAPLTLAALGFIGGVALFA